MILSSVVKTGVVATAVVTGYLVHSLWTTETPVVNVDNPHVQSVQSPTNNKDKKSIVRLTPSSSRVVYLDEPVMPDSATRIIKRLKELDKTREPVYLLINSPGGSVLSGMQIITQMEGMQAPVYTVCTQLCASMAAFIHQYGVKRYSLDRSYLMFHPASGGAEGQLPNVLSLLGTIQHSLDKMNTYIAHRSKLTLDQLERKLAYQLWIDGEDAVASGLSDGLVNLPTVDNEETSIFNFGNKNPDTTKYYEYK